jgi:2-polyprenyl-6-methoxyphenol hydroxylase-like FAD-dependent oxidoreductase
MHVLIIGGGIGGLCLAQGLRRRGVSVAVYERDRTPDARLQGYRLSIEPSGSAALHDCLPPELWQILVATSGDQGERMGVFDEQLRQLMEEDAKPDRGDPASGSHAVSRVTFRRVLLTGLDDAVHFGKEFTRYEEAGDGTVTATSPTARRPAATCWSAPTAPGPGSAASCCRTRAGSTPRPSASAGSSR